MPDFASEAERSKAGKNALRSRLLAARRSKSAPDRLAATAALQAVLLAAVRTHNPLTIAAYVPVGTEPGGADLPDVLINALPSGGRLLLPVLLDDGDLDWVTYTGVLAPGPRGLLQPDGARLGVDAVREASLVVVPALAVSDAGVRLGRGGGSYDRVLARLNSSSTAAGPSSRAPNAPGPDASALAGLRSHAARPSHPGSPSDSGPSDPPLAAALTVALLYDGEVLDEVPAEPHDHAVRAVITPSAGLVPLPRQAL
jgi:5-formyltetrahydrofolate cyclo-ligase